MERTVPSVAARGGMEMLRLALQRVHMTRASAYRDALRSFIEGYHESIQKVMEKGDTKSQLGDDPPKIDWSSRAIWSALCV